MPSFTQRIPNLEQVGPVIEMMITPSLAFMHAMNCNLASAKSIRVLAMIDTGASGTVISQGLAAQLGIKPVGTISIHTPSSTNVNCYQYDMQMLFPNNVNISSIIITEAPLQGQHIQCLIGRDVLRHGVLIYTGYDNSFTLSF
jgi:predicted aspartyl protease